MTPDNSHFQVRLAASESDFLAAQRLRYRVFVEELGGDGPLVDHAGRFERDEFDPVNDHLILIDTTRDAAAYDHVVGVYRLLRSDQAARFGRFYCDAEYDLGPLRAVSWEALQHMNMQDRTWGWTVEMQYKTAALGIATKQIDVPYRPRHAGQSKISNTIRGSIKAGWKILYTIAYLRLTIGGRRKPAATRPEARA